MTWFRNLNASLKLILSSSILLAFAAAIGIHGLLTMKEMNGRLETMYSRYFVGMLLIKNIEVAKMDAARSSRNAILKIGNNAGIDKEEKDLSALLTLMQDNLAKAEAIANVPETKIQLAIIGKLLPEYEQKTRKVFAAALTGDTAAAKAALEGNAAIIKRLNQAVRLASASQSDAASSNMSQNQESYTAARSATVGLLAASIALGVALSLWMARVFSAPLKKTVAVLNEVAHGNFTKTLAVDSKDEIGQMAAALNRAVAGISETIAQVAEASNSVGAASQELASATQKMSVGAEKQSAGLEQTSASLLQLTTTVQNNSTHANRASEVAAACRQGAEEGNRQISAAIAAMTEINAASAKIGTIVTTIDEMAFKTNLLAVNAAIEAASAGEHGRGFGVVSSEIRSLALSSTKSARNIGALVTNSLAKVENGSQLVNDSGATLRETVTSIKHVSTAVSEIAMASQEQLTGLQQVSSAMVQIDQAMQSNCVQNEEMLRTAARLADEASRLRQLVSRFTIARAN